MYEAVEISCSFSVILNSVTESFVMPILSVDLNQLQP